MRLLGLQMGASLDLTPVQPAYEGAVNSAAGGAGGGGRPERDWRSVREFGDGVSDFVLSPRRSRPSRSARQARASAQPYTVPIYTSLRRGAPAAEPDGQVYSPTAPVYSPTSPHCSPGSP